MGPGTSREIRRRVMYNEATTRVKQNVVCQQSSQLQCFTPGVSTGKKNRGTRPVEWKILSTFELETWRHHPKIVTCLINYH